jgi:hypothetical protein
VKCWLARHKRFIPHFTPTSCSWLNLVERLFAEITWQRIRLWRGQCPTKPEQIGVVVRRQAGDDARIGIETGAMTPWLVHEFAISGSTRCQAGTRRPQDANQQDGSDRRGRLGSDVRTGWYRAVHVKSFDSHRARALLGSPRSHRYPAGTTSSQHSPGSTSSTTSTLRGVTCLAQVLKSRVTRGHRAGIADDSEKTRKTVPKTGVYGLHHCPALRETPRQ